MANAICVQCGAAKKDWSSKCAGCDFDPCADFEAQAKSYILSTLRVDDGMDPAESWGLPEFSEKELDVIGWRIRNGMPYKFNEENVCYVAEIFEESSGPMSWRDILVICSFILGGVVAFIGLVFFTIRASLESFFRLSRFFP